MNFQDFLKEASHNLTGVNLGGETAIDYDAEHCRKIEELVNKDVRYLYAIQLKCGIDPFCDDHSNNSGDIAIVNVGHFAIKDSAEDRTEELIKKVNDCIDWVYNNRKAALEEVDEQSPFDW